VLYLYTKHPEAQSLALYGVSIAAKRYALYEKTGKSNTNIVDPKAHGVGFLYPPTNSPPVRRPSFQVQTVEQLSVRERVHLTVDE